jgi:hypothetical protein
MDDKYIKEKQTLLKEPYGKRALSVALVAISNLLNPDEYTDFLSFYNTSEFKTYLSCAIMLVVCGDRDETGFDKEGRVVYFRRLSNPNPKYEKLRKDCQAFNAADNILSGIENYFYEHPKDPVTGEDLAPLKPVKERGDHIIEVKTLSDIVLFGLVKRKYSQHGVFHRVVGTRTVEGKNYCYVYMVDPVGGRLTVSPPPPQAGLVLLENITHCVVPNYTLSVVAQQVVHGSKEGNSKKKGAADLPVELLKHIFEFAGADSAYPLKPHRSSHSKGSLRKGGKRRRTKRSSRR